MLSNNQPEKQQNSKIEISKIRDSSIVITNGQEKDIEILNAKDKIKAEIEEMLINFPHPVKDENAEDATPKVSDDNFDEIELDELIAAIENGNCILFLGPEIAIDSEGNSLHKKFYKEISNNKRTYNEEEEFFMPGAETRLINICKKFYNNTFPEQNKNGYSLLTKLARIPFSLIINVSPDNTIHQIYNKYGIEHEYIYYTATKHETNQNLFSENDNKVVIYNALGCAASNGRYIYTHKLFNDYLKNEVGINFPLDIENKIQNNETTHYVFMGFNFNSWHKRLLLFELNLLNLPQSYALDGNTTQLTYQELIEKQFNISFIKENCQLFTNLLLDKTIKAGLARSLSENQEEQLILKLEEIRARTVDADKMTDLIFIKNDLLKLKAENWQS